MTLSVEMFNLIILCTYIQYTWIATIYYNVLDIIYYFAIYVTINVMHSVYRSTISVEIIEKEKITFYTNVDCFFSF